MDIPDLLPIAEAQRECGEADVALFNYGLEEAKPLRFFVIVPEHGAFQVPRKALSHFQAGETEYLAHDLREHWNSDPLPEYLIRRDKLFVYADDWYRRMADVEELQQCMERIPVPLRLGFLPVEHIATAIARAVLGIEEDRASAEPNPRLLHESAEWQSLMLRLANERKLSLRNAQGLEFSGPFEESFLASAEIAAVRGLFELPPSPDRKYPRRISFEVYLPGHSLRSVVRSDGSVTTGWYEDAASPEPKEEAPQILSVPAVQKNSTKDTKAHALNHVIALAQSKCADPTDYQEVYARLEVLAVEEEPPLLGSTADGLKYSDQGVTKFYNKRALKKKLERAAAK